MARPARFQSWSILSVCFSLFVFSASCGAPANRASVNSYPSAKLGPSDSIKKILARVRASGAELNAFGKWYLKSELCREWAVYPDEDKWPSAGETGDEECTMETQLGGTALVLVRHPSCEETCEAALWVLGAREKFTFVTGYEDGEVVVLPGGIEVVFHRAEVREGEVHSFGLYREILGGKHVLPLSDCISPRLSPSQKWIVCRDLEGNVRKVSPQGGRSLLVHSFNHNARPLINFHGEENGYPAAVTFSAANKMIVSTDVMSDWAGRHEFRETIEWRE